jgi:hypothetical protein
MTTLHLGVYLYPVARALGVKGAVPVLMTLKYYVELLDWQLMYAVKSQLVAN